MNTTKTRDTSPRETEHRRIGFATLLITAGIVWLLYTLRLIPASGVNIALSLWPLALIAIGADLLMRQQYPQLSTLVIAAIAVFVVLAALLAPRLGIGVLETRTDSYSETLGNAESATIMLNPSVGQIEIRALEQDDMLFTADATYLGELNWDVRGTTQRRIEFGQNEVSTTNWLGTDADLAWNIGLSPRVPLTLNVNTGVGDSTLDFADLTLRDVVLNTGVGQVDMTLPDQDDAYQVIVSGGVGSLDVALLDRTNVDLTINSGVGQVNLDLPDDAAVRVQLSSGMGRIQMPGWLEQITDGNDEEIWQSLNYVDASDRIDVIIESGLGGLRIR